MRRGLTLSPLSFILSGKCVTYAEPNALYGTHWPYSTSSYQKLVGVDRVWRANVIDDMGIIYPSI